MRDLTFGQRRISIGLALALLLGMAGLASAQQQVSAGQAHGDPGDAVVLPIQLAGNGPAAVLQLDVTYDANALEVDAARGAALGAHILSSAKPSSGLLRLILHAGDNAALQNGQVVRLDVEIDPLAPGGVDQPIGLTAAVLGDASANALTTALTDGTVRVDTGPLPRVQKVQTVPALPRFGFTRLTVQFSEAVRDPAGDSSVDDVTNPANFLLVAAGPDGVVDTVSCAGGAALQDVAILVDAVFYESPSSTATLELAGDLAVPAGPYRLFACDAILDLNRNALDGNADGTPGTDYQIALASESTNLLRNPNFDLDLAAWSLASPSVLEITHHTDDADALTASGSAEIRNQSGSGQVFALAQCVELDGSEAYFTGGRIRVSSGLPADPVDFATVDFYDAPACGGTQLTTTLSRAVLGDTAGSWSDALASFITPPAGAVSAMVSFLVEAGAAAEFTAHYDSLFFAGGQSEVFGDDFESGGLLNWTRSLGNPP